MAELKYEIVKSLGSFGEGPKGIKELNMVSWNDRPAKYDIREWNEDHTQMSKGLTFTLEEAKALKDLLNQLPELKG